MMMVKISFLHYVAAVIHTPNRNTVAGNRAQSGVNNPIFIVGGSWSLYSHVDLLDELLDWRKSLTAVRTAGMCRDMSGLMSTNYGNVEGPTNALCAATQLCYDLSTASCEPVGSFASLLHFVFRLQNCSCRCPCPA